MNIVGEPIVRDAGQLTEEDRSKDEFFVKLHTREYKLSAANDALHDLHHGRVNGRAVLIP